MVSVMRIVVVAPSDVGGGAEGVARTLWQGYRRAGHHATLAVGRRSHETDADVVELPYAEGRNLVAQGLLTLADNAADSPAAGALNLVAKASEPLRRLRKQLGHEDMHHPGSHRLLDLVEQADVLHLHNLHGGYFDLRILPRLTARVPTVITLHDQWLFTGHCAAALDCTRWERGCGRCPDLARYPSLHRDGTLFNHARKAHLVNRSRFSVTAPARWLLEHAQRSLLATGATGFFHTTHGVDPAVFHPRGREDARARLGLPASMAVVAYDASALRGYRRVAWARQAVLQCGVRPLCVVEMGRVAGGLNATEDLKVRTPGHLDPEGVADVLRAADVYLHPTVADTYPSSVLEAQACGAVVVGTDVGGLCEQIAHGEDGWRVAPGGEPMGHALDQALTNPERLVAMSAAASRKVRSTAQMVFAYLDVLTAAAEGSRPTG